MIEIAKKTDEKKFKCELPTWQEINKLAKVTAEKIKESDFYPDIIISIARGGLVPARLLSDLLYIKDVVAIKAEHWGITATKDGKAKISYALNMDLTGKKVLIVDDITDTGQSMDLAKKHVAKRNPDEIKTATLYHLNNSKYTPDFYGIERSWAWMIFPWNYWEDLVNLIKKVVSKPEQMDDKYIYQQLKKRFGLSISESKIREVIAHIRYLKQKKKLE